MAGAIEGGLFAAGALDTKVGEFVPVAGGIEVHAVVKVADVVAVSQVEFQTAVHHGAEVADRGGVTCVCGNGHFVKHAGGELVVVVHGCGELVAPEAEVYAKVCLDGLFPLDAGVGKAGRLGAAGDGLGAVSAGTEGVVVAAVCVNCIAEVADGVVTVDTPGATELEGGDPVLSLEEGFVLDVPANGD